MFLERTDRNRESFKFPVKGKDLFQAAKERANYFRQKEKEYRTKLGGLISNLVKRLSSDENKKLEMAAIDAATNAERCEVWAWAFEREPDREFLLSCSDVVFFGLAGHAISEDSEN